MFALKFLSKANFDSYEDYKQNAIPQVPDNFNFAYDVIDALAIESPDKVALIWNDDAGDKKTFTFRDLARASNAAANFLSARGIKKGDTVLLFMRGCDSNSFDESTKGRGY